MSVQFNTPPAWRKFLPNGFTPESKWIPERQWGPPPAGWPLWIDSTTGHPAPPPEQYRQNPYLYFSVMPGATEGGDQADAFALGADTTVFSSVQKPAKPARKGLKIGLGVVAGVVVIGIIGALSSGGDADRAAETKPSSVESVLPSPQEAMAVDDTQAEESASAASVAAAESSAQAKAEASSQAAAEASQKAEEEKEAKAAAEESRKAEEAEAKAAAEASAKAEEESGTLSQQNALSQAENYLSFMAFSQKGLIDQLEFEGYPTKDAKWAVEHLSVNWNEQAAKKAEEYLDTMSFSRSGLVDQLIFEGFSKKQAEYGVKSTGL